MQSNTHHRIFSMPVASIYPLYITKLEKKERTESELLAVIEWLTGYTEPALHKILKNQIDFKTFFAEAPHMNPNRQLITGLKYCAALFCSIIRSIPTGLY